MHPFSTPLKTLENRKAALGTNGLEMTAAQTIFLKYSPVINRFENNRYKLIEFENITVLCL